MKFIPEPIVIVDVETTGGSPRWHRITEIACIRFENGIEVDRFVSLVNPEQSVPIGIQYLTGITNDMLTTAPTWSDIQERVSEIFEGAILVAHNARFDYSFIKAEMKRSEIPFTRKILCTARLSRKLFPEFPRHNLSVIIERYQLTCSARHRALGDTEALRDFLLHIEKHHPEEAGLASLEIMKRSYLPPKLEKSLIQNLPEGPGVYYLYDKEGALLYVGKSVNVKARVISHFHSTHTSGSEMRLWRETKHIDALQTGSDLGASLLELDQIKTLSPLYNRRGRRTRGLWYLVKTLEHPYATFTLEKSATRTSLEEEKVYAVFKEKRQALKLLEKFTDEEGICPKTFGLEKGPGPCFLFQLGKCTGACVGKEGPEKYNTRIELLFAQRKVRHWPYSGPILLIASTKGKQKDFFLIDNWQIQSAYTSREESLEPLFPLSDPIFDCEVYRLLSKELLKPSKGTSIYTDTTPEYQHFIHSLEEGV